MAVLGGGVVICIALHGMDGIPGFSFECVVLCCAEVVASERKRE